MAWLRQKLVREWTRTTIKKIDPSASNRVCTDWNTELNCNCNHRLWKTCRNTTRRMWWICRWMYVVLNCSVSETIYSRKMKLLCKLRLLDNVLFKVTDKKCIWRTGQIGFHLCCELLQIYWMLLLVYLFIYLLIYLLMYFQIYWINNNIPDSAHFWPSRLKSAWSLPPLCEWWYSLMLITLNVCVVDFFHLYYYIIDSYEYLDGSFELCSS